MSLQPPIATEIGQVWVDPITADRFEWDGTTWVNLGSNADYMESPWGDKEDGRA